MRIDRRKVKLFDTKLSGNHFKIEVLHFSNDHRKPIL